MDNHVFKVSQEREYNGFIAKGKLFLSGLLAFLSPKEHGNIVQGITGFHGSSEAWQRW